MARQPGRVFTRAQLLDAVHGVAVESYERAIDAHVKNIRRKIERDPRAPGCSRRCSASGTASRTRSGERPPAGGARGRERRGTPPPALVAGGHALPASGRLPRARRRAPHRPARRLLCRLRPAHPARRDLHPRLAAARRPHTNFNISLQNTLQGPVHIEALNKNVTVTVGSQPTLTSAAFPQAGRLHIKADAGRTVTFNLKKNNLAFIGSNDRVTQMLVSFAGEGQLVFLLGDGKRVAFASDDLTHSAGTNFYVVMSDVRSGPTVAFMRANDNSDQNVEVLVGHDSTMTYLARHQDTTSVNAKGTILFSQANVKSTVKTILRVLDKASIDIAGHSF